VTVVYLTPSSPIQSASRSIPPQSSSQMCDSVINNCNTNFASTTFGIHRYSPSQPPKNAAFFIVAPELPQACKPDKPRCASGDGNKLRADLRVPPANLPVHPELNQPTGTSASDAQVCKSITKTMLLHFPNVTYNIGQIGNWRTKGLYLDLS
jgi:hypothetical protein